MFGISYWNKHDGSKLAEHIKQVYEMPGGKERYWDQVALEYFIKEYNVEVRECTFNDIIEIDTFSELKKLDEIYRV
jgi:CTP:phosphocholine cytidylyltransferase-like protein